MTITPSIPVFGKSEILPPLISAFFIVMFLFFIDEGYYDFRWMKDLGNWLVFGFYMALFFLLQWVIWKFLPHQLAGWQRTLVMAVLGIGFAFGFLWLVS